jgi:hypothetical protein
MSSLRRSDPTFGATIKRAFRAAEQILPGLIAPSGHIA